MEQVNEIKEKEGASDKIPRKEQRTGNKTVKDEVKLKGDKMTPLTG